MQKATDAKTSTDNSQIQEKINLAYHSSLVDGQGEVTEPSLENELKKEFNKNSLDEGWMDKTSVEGKWKITIDGVSLEVPAGKQYNKDTGKVTIKASSTNTNLKDVSNLSTLYGETTDYTSVEGVQWQLFYDDTTYLYLIASDYVLGNSLPSELLTDGQYTSFCRSFANWDDISGNYTGTIMENTPWINGTESSTITENIQTSNYLKWVNSDVVTTTNNPNMIAVAFMMDTSKWSNFAGEASGATAIGGPTLEMFVLSYNAKHDTKLGTYGTVASDITSDNANKYGYRAKIGTDNWENDIMGLDTSSDNMWVKTASDKAYAYWVASPASDSSIGVSDVNCDGELTYDICEGKGNGFRPIVSIPKSSLK